MKMVGSTLSVTRFYLLLLVLCFSLGPDALPAQDPSATEEISKPNDARRLVELTFPDSALSAVVDVIFDQLSFSFPTLSKDELRVIRGQFDVATLKDRLADIYDSSFTAVEIADLLEWYSSPQGAKAQSAELAAWQRSLVEGTLAGRRLIEKAVAGKRFPEVQWLPFRPDDSTFQVMLPGEPSEMTIPTETPSGVIDAHQFMTTSSYCAYIVSFADSALGDGDGAADPLLSGVARSVINRVGGELVSEITYTHEAGPGRELTIMLADGDGVYRVRLFTSGTRLYQLTAVTPISEYYTSQAVHFLDSFELLRE